MRGSAVFPVHQVGMAESGLPRSSAVRNQSCSGTSSPFEVDEALTLGRMTSHRTLTVLRRRPMSTEPLTTTTATTAVAASSERGLLIAVLIMVLLGAGAMLLMP